MRDKDVKGLVVLFGLPLLCICGCVSAIQAVSGCPIDDFFYNGLLGERPTMVLPEGSYTLQSYGTQGTAGGAGGSMATTELTPDEVAHLLTSNGGDCFLSDGTIYQPGGFEYELGERYWECHGPAQPWSRGSAVILPRPAYISSLRQLQADPPDLPGGRPIDETTVGHELELLTTYLRNFPTALPSGGSVIVTYVTWCSP